MGTTMGTGNVYDDDLETLQFADEGERLGRQIDLEGFEIEMLMDLLKVEIDTPGAGANPDYRQDLKDLLDKLAA